MYVCYKFRKHLKNDGKTKCKPTDMPPIWLSQKTTTAEWDGEILQWRHNEQNCVSNQQRLDCFSSVYSGDAQRKHQSSVSLAFVKGIHRWSVNSSHNGPVTRKMFPFDDTIMISHYISYDQVITQWMTLVNSCWVDYIGWRTRMLSQ